jgi:multiple sugar transport system substrate-binding protein
VADQYGTIATRRPRRRWTRRTQLLRTAAGLGATGAVAGCAGSAPAGSAGRPAKTAPTTIRLWFHWGGATGAAAQQLIDEYNRTQGQQDKNAVAVEVVDSGLMQEKLTAAAAGGDPPDVWHTASSPKETSAAGLTVPFPKDEEQYVRQNYVPGAVGRMTLGGKVWGYPTEFQAPAHFYRRSHYRETGITSPPATTDEVYDIAIKLTRKDAGAGARFGYALNFDNTLMAYHLPSLIARFGGQMYVFDGDRPTKIDVATPPAIEAVGWWKRLIDAGVTQVGQMAFTDALRQGNASAAEYEVWWPLINLKNTGLTEVYDDLGFAVLPPKRGQKPAAFAYGWSLTAPKGARQPDERWPLMGWLMHKPAMPFSRFIVETVGAMPSPKDYPAPIPGWSDEMYKTYAVEMAKVAQGEPMARVLGWVEIRNAITEAIAPILTSKVGLQPGLAQLTDRLNEILLRNNRP